MEDHEIAVVVISCASFALALGVAVFLATRKIAEAKSRREELERRRASPRRNEPLAQKAEDAGEPPAKEGAEEDAETGVQQKSAEAPAAPAAAAETPAAPAAEPTPPPAPPPQPAAAAAPAPGKKTPAGPDKVNVEALTKKGGLGTGQRGFVAQERAGIEAVEKKKSREEAEEEIQRRPIVGAESEKRQQVCELKRRFGKWIMSSRKRPGSFGLKIADDSQPCKILSISEQGAASKAVLTRSDGSALPESERRLKPKDLIVKTTGPVSSAAKKTYYGDGTWPVFCRQQLLKSVGANAGVFEGTEITLWVVRDRDFQKQWLEQFNAFISASMSGSVGTVGGQFGTMNGPDDPPLPPGAVKFPTPGPDVMLKATFTMSAASKKSVDIRKQQLGKLQSKHTLNKIDLDTLYAIQHDPQAAEEFIRPIFLEFDTDKSNDLDPDEMQKLHLKLTEAIGLPPLQPHVIEQQFKLADINDDGRLSYDEFYYFIRDQLLEAMFRVEEHQFEGMAALSTMQHPGMGMSQSGAGMASSGRWDGSMHGSGPMSPLA